MPMSENITAVDSAGPDLRPCARHPDIETGLSCNRCGTPICPRCMVQTPVGSRCPDCAQLRRLPTFDVRGKDYAKAAGAALAVAMVTGLLWSLLPLRGWGTLVLALIVGLAAGEAISRVTNRKRSAGLKALAAATVIVAYWMSIWIPFFERMGAMAAGPLGLPVAMEAAARLALASVANPMVLIGLAVGAYIATTRIDR